MKRRHRLSRRPSSSAAVATISAAGDPTRRRHGCRGERERDEPEPKEGVDSKRGMRWWWLVRVPPSPPPPRRAAAFSLPLPSNSAEPSSLNGKENKGLHRSSISAKLWPPCLQAHAPINAHFKSLSHTPFSSALETLQKQLGYNFKKFAASSDDAGSVFWSLHGDLLGNALAMLSISEYKLSRGGSARDKLNMEAEYQLMFLKELLMKMLQRWLMVWLPKELIEINLLNK